MATKRSTFGSVVAGSPTAAPCRLLLRRLTVNTAARQRRALRREGRLARTGIDAAGTKS